MASSEKQIKQKLTPVLENIAESTTACLVTMVQGNLLALTFAHWAIASRTGVIAGVVASAAILIGGTGSRAVVSVVLGVVTAVVDYFVHPGHFGPAMVEAAVTGLAAAALSHLVGSAVRRLRRRRSGDTPAEYERLRGLSALLCATSLALSAACGVQETDGSPEMGAQSASLRLYVLDCGSMRGDPARFRLLPEEVSTTEMSVPCFLVSHPEGTLLWDTGAVPDQEWTPTGNPVPHHVVLPDASERDLILRRPLLGQLAELGYAPADVTYLALSHYHWDHVGNANAFAGATWLVREVERDAMFADVPPVTLPQNFARLENSKTVIIQDDDYDIFGDGTVIIKSAPGHTPGHQVLYLRLQRTGDVLLSGDVYHFPESRMLRRVPTFDFDQEQTPVTREAIEAFLASTGAQLWIQHDAVGNAMLKKSPQYYD